VSEKAQLTALKNSIEFNSAFTKLLTEKKSLSASEKEYILLCSLLFFKVYNNDRRFKNYFKMGYYIILKYSLLFNDFRPLYDISMQIGFYPICKTILNLELLTFDSISQLISFNIVATKFENPREKYLETLEQHLASRSLLESSNQNLLYIAPTSFGKSSLIKDFIQNGVYSKIGIIVPTKSLLVQTYRDIKELNLDFKIITHDEMYSGEDRFIAILTQERATRLLRKNISFDVLFIDEAHNILRYNNNNLRGVLLARLIELNQSVNNHKIIYLSPLIDNPDSIKSNGSELTSAFVNHNLKSDDIFLLEENGNVSIYNRFTNEYINLEQQNSYFDYISKTAQKKNFIYNYRPKKIEDLARELYDKVSEVSDDSEINLIIETLANEVHENFYVNKYIKKGIVYIHGKIPNQIKEYLEYKFKTVLPLKFIIANKVILEGINLPIETIFITSTTYLDGKDLVNLIGRVNRLNYVFQENNLEKLNPKIHFLDSAHYQGTHSMKNKIELLRSHSFKDKVENPVLSSYDIDNLEFSKTDILTKEQVKEKRRDRDKILQENTGFLIANRDDQSLSISIKRYFIENSFEEFFNDLNAAIDQILLNLEVTKTEEWLSSNLIQKIVSIFITNHVENIKDYEIERLKNNAAQNYYNYYLTTTQKQALKANIVSTFQYLKTKSNSPDPYLFIGNSYGEVVRFSNVYNNQVYRDTVYVNLAGRSDENLINLSIIKLKIEEDFVSYKLNKLVVFLYDFQLISEEEYYVHIYGTTDNELIRLVRLGLVPSAVHKIIEDGQSQNLRLSPFGNLVANDQFNNYLNLQNDIFKFEIMKFL
jgi:hypothetical protein